MLRYSPFIDDTRSESTTWGTPPAPERLRKEVPNVDVTAYGMLCPGAARQAMARLVEPTDEVFPAVRDDSRSRSFHAHKCTRSFSETETRNTEREHMLPT